MKNIIFVCKADKSVGAGHINRCIALAEYLSRRITMHAIFITNQDCHKKIIDRGFIPVLPNDVDLASQILSFTPKIVVFDLHKTPEELIMIMKTNLVPTISLCYFDDNRGLCDVSISAVKTNRNSDPGYFEGADYVLLCREYLKGKIKIRRRATKIFVYAKTPAVYKLMRKVLKNEPFDITYMTHNHQKDVKWIDYMSDTSQTLKSCDMAIVPMDSFLFQCLAIGLPTIIISHNNREEECAKRFVNLNAALHLGHYKNIKIREAKNMIRKISHKQAKRKLLQFHSRNMINRESCNNIYRIYKKLIGEDPYHGPDVQEVQELP